LTSSLSIALIVVVIVWYIWIFAEVNRFNMSTLWLILGLPLSVGLAIALMFPLFQGFREGAILKSQNSQTLV
ncbi:MAG: DUF2834 domain-containing protein, partial [Chloroflexota bacterium]